MDKSLEYIKIRFVIIFLFIVGHFFGYGFLQGELALEYASELCGKRETIKQRNTHV